MKHSYFHAKEKAFLSMQISFARDGRLLYRPTRYHSYFMNVTSYTYQIRVFQNLISSPDNGWVPSASTFPNRLRFRIWGSRSEGSSTYSLGCLAPTNSSLNQKQV